jgi:hypothetical protein
MTTETVSILQMTGLIIGETASGLYFSPTEVAKAFLALGLDEVD